MPSFNDVISGAPAQASDIQQVIAALKGTAGQGIPLSPTAVNDPINYAVAVKNNDAGASKALVVYKADGTVLLQIDKNGVFASPDGISGATQLATLTSTQTLSNKTLNAPLLVAAHLTTPVVDSGGLAVTLGNVGIGGGTPPVNWLGVQVGPLLTGSSVQFGLQANPIGDIGATNEIAAVYAQVRTQAAAFTTATAPAYHAANPQKGAGSAITSAYGLLVDAMTNGNVNNYGIFVQAPSGGSGNNVGVNNLGSAQLCGSGQRLGAFGATVAVQQTATGSRAGNAALASLLTALAQYGLIVDGTSA